MLEAARAVCADYNHIGGKRFRALQNLLRRLAAVDEDLDVRIRRPETPKHLLARLFHLVVGQHRSRPKAEDMKSVSGTTRGLHT